MRWFAAVLLSVAIVAVAAQTAVARPRACDLLTRPLVEDYLNTEMDRTSNVRDFCDWQSQLADLHRGGDVRLTTWRLRANAKSTINAVCGQRAAKHLSFKGYNRACGFEGNTGLCFDTSTGTDCEFDVKIAFRRGRTTGSLDVASLRSYSLNDLEHAIPFARRVLQRWK